MQQVNSAGEVQTELGSLNHVPQPNRTEQKDCRKCTRILFIRHFLYQINALTIKAPINNFPLALVACSSCKKVKVDVDA